MTANGWVQIYLFFALVLLVTKPLGIFMTRVFNREKTFMDPVLRPIERLLYRVTGVDENHEMRWTEYAIAMLLFSLVSMIVLYLMQRLQGSCPSIRKSLVRSARLTLAFNTAASFTTNTNWQTYARRVNDELSHANGWTCLSQFRFSGDGHCLGHRFHSRRRPTPDANHRQFLG